MCVLVSQSCPALGDPMDCSPPGSSVQKFQARILEWVAILVLTIEYSVLKSRPEYWSGYPFPSPGGSSPTQRLNLDLLHARQILYHLSHQETHQGRKYTDKHKR